MKVIALEEHFATPMLAGLRPRNASGVFGDAPNRTSDAMKRWGHDPEAELLSLGDSRVAAMDKSGIDMQVLGFAGSNDALIHDPKIAIPLARDANDQAYATIQKYPGRFAAFATLPMADVAESIRELERCVTKLGFKGAMIRGHTEGTFLDDKEKYWGLFEAAEALDVPVYIHPNEPPDEVNKIYFEGFKELQSAAWGYSMDVGTRFLRLMFAGVFDAYPKLKIILGHLGEGIPFFFDRMQHHTFLYAERQGLKRTPAQYMRENLMVTSSGNFSVPSFLCTVMILGIDNVMFSIDWPYEPNTYGKDFLAKLPISEHDMAKFTHLNAERLLKL